MFDWEMCLPLTVRWFAYQLNVVSPSCRSWSPRARLIGKTVSACRDLAGTSEQNLGADRAWCAKSRRFEDGWRLTFSSTFKSSQKSEFQNPSKSFIADTCSISGLLGDYLGPCPYVIQSKLRWRGPGFDQVFEQPLWGSSHTVCGCLVPSRSLEAVFGASVVLVPSPLFLWRPSLHGFYVSSCLCTPGSLAWAMQCCFEITLEYLERKHFIDFQGVPRSHDRQHTWEEETRQPPFSG